MNRPRFSLRLLLVAVAVLCAVSPWLAYHRSFVLERRAIRSELEAKGASFYGPDTVGGVFQHHVGPKPSWIRKLLGDEEILAISVPLEKQSDQVAREAERWFPEADIMRHVDVPRESLEMNRSPLPPTSPAR